MHLFAFTIGGFARVMRLWDSRAAILRVRLHGLG